MIYFKNSVNKKQEIEIANILFELNDIYKDFYLTINNKRIFILNDIGVLFNKLRKGDKIAYTKGGVLIVTGFSDKSKRKYLKILADLKTAEQLLKFLGWNLNRELFIKVKKDNPLLNILLRNGFFRIGNRGREVLLKRNKKEIRYERNNYNKK